MIEQNAARTPLPERVLRRALHFYWRIQRGMTLGTRCMVLDDERGVFLVEHTYVSGWHLPGGGVEPGETLVESLARELSEEANIAPTAEPALHGVFFNATASRRDHVAVYIVRTFTQHGPRSPDREIKGARFFPLDALPSDTTPGTLRRIAEVTRGVPVTATW